MIKGYCAKTTPELLWVNTKEDPKVQILKESVLNSVTTAHCKMGYYIGGQAESVYEYKTYCRAHNGKPKWEPNNLYCERKTNYCAGVSKSSEKQWTASIAAGSVGDFAIVQCNPGYRFGDAENSNKVIEYSMMIQPKDIGEPLKKLDSGRSLDTAVMGTAMRNKLLSETYVKMVKNDIEGEGIYRRVTQCVTSTNSKGYWTSLSSEGHEVFDNSWAAGGDEGKSQCKLIPDYCEKTARVRIDSKSVCNEDYHLKSGGTDPKHVCSKHKTGSTNSNHSYVKISRGAAPIDEKIEEKPGSNADIHAILPWQELATTNGGNDKITAECAKWEPSEDDKAEGDDDDDEPTDVQKNIDALQKNNPGWVAPPPAPLGADSPFAATQPHGIWKITNGIIRDKPEFCSTDNLFWSSQREHGGFENINPLKFMGKSDSWRMCSLGYRPVFRRANGGANSAGLPNHGNLDSLITEMIRNSNSNSELIFTVQMTRIVCIIR
jgi:hypothetical protein